ncbi:MAG: hypothetical protein ACI865_003248, partial [Flavobacteriaceae bacterium]
MFKIIITTTLIVFQSSLLLAQSPGLIYYPAGGNGVTPLNPNGDAWSSTAFSGYSSNDLLESEILYQPLPVPYKEEASDITVTTNCGFSDIVGSSFSESGVYMYSDGTNLLFRFRQGGTVNTSKGYSILIDTDMKFGCCGANADPNYVANTTVANGNPGFEIEIVLETNFQVAMYNVDGIDNPAIPVRTYPIGTNHQRSVALTNNCDDPDFFHDFYVVLADLYSDYGITSSTPLRYAATTVMAPKPALGGPLSDINGGESYEDIINYQCGTPIGATPTSGEPCSCTNPPTMNGPIPSGTNVPITGNWNALTAEKPNNATIELFVNGIEDTSTSTTGGAGWNMTLPGPLVNGDTIYATAQATGEGVCDPNPQTIIVSDCNAGNTPAQPIITCIGFKGIAGTSEPNNSIKIYRFLAPPAIPTEELVATIAADPSGMWGWDGITPINNPPPSVCTSGGGDMLEGTYHVVQHDLLNSCPSASASICLDRSGGAYPLMGTATSPTITTPLITVYSSEITGTSLASDHIRLYKNGYPVETTAADGFGDWSFTNVPFGLGDIVTVTAQADLTCESAPATMVVECEVLPPSINSNLINKVPAGSVLGGTSSVVGATISIYDASAPGIPIETGIPIIGGVWASTITAAVGVTYFATTVSACGSSTASWLVIALPPTPDRCGTFTATPYNDQTTIVSGTLSSAVPGTEVNLYIDVLIDDLFISTTNTNVWSVPIAGELSGGATLTFGIQEPGMLEFLCPASELVICVPPPAFSVTPSTAIITTFGGVATFSLSSTTPGVLYAVENVSLPNEDIGVSLFSTGADFDLVTFPYTIPGTYPVQIKAMTFNGDGCTNISPATIIANFSLGTDTRTECSPYIWIDGNTYTASNNTATHILTNAVGSDSLVTLDLTINYSSASTDTQVACDTYTWPLNSTTYTSSASSPTVTLTNAAGCDSIVTLDLTINNSNSGTDAQVACDTYTWPLNSITYTSSTNTPTV